MKALPAWFRKTDVKVEPAPPPPPTTAATKTPGLPTLPDTASPQPQPQPPSRSAPAPKKRAAATAQSIARASSIPEKAIDALSTYDKEEKSGAPDSVRYSVFQARLDRSNDKVGAYAENSVPSAVDDSLLSDTVGNTARVYERHAAYVGAARPGEKREREDMEGVEGGGGDGEGIDDNDDDEVPETEPIVIDDTPIYPSGQVGPRSLLIPIPTAVPRTADAPIVKTYSEYTGKKAATAQFDRTMRHITGPEQGTSVAVRDDATIYKEVTSMLDDPFRSQQLSRYAISRGMAIPNPPVISKERIRDGLQSPDYELNERPCVNGTNCASYKMCMQHKKEDPEKYANVDPFPCKEFYIGEQGEAIRVALAEGGDLRDIYGQNLQLCVMCHLAIVTIHYKEYDLGLTSGPPHILNAFQVIYGVKGEYPFECLLMGDDTFKGVAGPYPRHVFDNYIWEPVPPKVVRVEGAFDPVTGQPVYERRQWSSEEAVGHGRLTPRRPYIVRVNTFHVPTVESTLLRNLTTKGTLFSYTAPLVFQDDILGTRRYLQLGGHLEKSATFAKALTLLPHAGNWAIRPGTELWRPACFDVLAEQPARDYLILVALYWRVNGAYDILSTYNAKDLAGRHDATEAKIDEFVNRHLLLSMYVDAVADPRAELTDKALIASGKYALARPCGLTDYPQDRDAVTVKKTPIKLVDTPLEVLAKSGVFSQYELDDFAHPSMEGVIGAWATRIAAMTDAQLMHAFVEHEGVGCLLDSYYPIKMQTPEQCRLHTWYLACLVIVNRAWVEVDAREGDVEAEAAYIAEMATAFEDSGNANDDVFSDDDEEEAGEDDGDEEEEEEEEEGAAAAAPAPKRGPRKKSRTLADRPRVQWKHTAAVRHAFYCILGGFVKLFYHAILENSISDDAWRPRPDEKPTVLDKYFPYDTASLHGGDLPMLGSLIEQIGLYGVQVVKNRIPLVRLLIKSLPVCCQSRDLAKCFITECTNIRGEGYWRAVRPMFYCTMTGLYSHSEHRVDFRSMMRAYEMLYESPILFFDALGREMAHFEDLKRAALARGSTEKIKCNNKSAQLIYATMREFVIYSTEKDSEWIGVVTRRINWKNFVDHTLSMTDELRMCARYADAPKGDDLLYGINALWRHKSTYASSVYRFRKKEYVPTLMSRIGIVRDDLYNKRQIVEAEMRITTALFDKLIEKKVITPEELRPVASTRHAQALRRDPHTGVVYKSPLILYQTNPAGFGDAVRAALLDSYTNHADLAYTVDPAIKINIMRFVMQLHPDRRMDPDHLLDPRLGGVSRESIQTIGKTRVIYMTRSSPLSILRHVENMPIRDICVYSWYFNCVSRMQKFNLIPLDADTISAQAEAMRRRYRLLPHEPLPASAWIVYLTLCCGRVATFHNTSVYGTYAIAYDPRTKNMVCSKKIARTTRDRKRGGGPAKEDTPAARAKRDAKGKKARLERNDDNHVPCDSQPAMPVDLWGYALEFAGERYMFCPSCAQFHIYRALGWGRRGYMCRTCREKETPVRDVRTCAYCQQPCGPDSEQVPVIALDSDPCNPEHDPYSDPLACFQTLHLCRPDANSAGFYGKHYTARIYSYLPKDELWAKIGPAGVARRIRHAQKYG